MRILHTGDWHLGDRIGTRGVDRTDDLRRNVERIAAYCDDERIDVLLVAGDLFSDKLDRQRDIGDTVKHLSDTFAKFLRGGGTIVSLTGNHDKEIPCQTLKHTLSLADPRPLAVGGLAHPGRLYLATQPTFYRLADRAGVEVQFILMPYPTPAAYRDEFGAGAGGNKEELNARLRAAYTSALEKAMTHPAYSPARQTVLAAHVHVQGVKPHALYQLTEADDVLFAEGNIPTGFAYVALGHIHKPQCIGVADHVRYSGSIERLDFGEAEDQKSVAVVEVGAAGRVGPVRTLPLDATPIYKLVLDQPHEQVPRLAAQYPDARTALVSYELHWQPGEHHREQLIRELEAIFPRWYSGKAFERGRDTEPTRHEHLPEQDLPPKETALHFLEKALVNDPDADAVLALARTILQEMKA